MGIGLMMRIWMVIRGSNLDIRCGTVLDISIVIRIWVVHLVASEKAMLKASALGRPWILGTTLTKLRDCLFWQLCMFKSGTSLRMPKHTSRLGCLSHSKQTIPYWLSWLVI